MAYSRTVSSIPNRERPSGASRRCNRLPPTSVAILSTTSFPMAPSALQTCCAASIVQPPTNTPRR